MLDFMGPLILNSVLGCFLERTMEYGTKYSIMASAEKTAPLKPK